MQRGRRTCPHCGAANPTSAIVTLCRKCGKSLSDTVLPPPVPRGAHPSPTAAPTPAPPPPPLPIPRPPWEASGLPDDLGTPDDAEPESPSVPPMTGLPPASADWPLRLPIGLHLALSILATMAAFIGLPILLMTRGIRSLPHWLPFPVLFFGGAVLGVLVARAAFRFLILGICPQCGRAARMQAGRPITYHCLACGHVHRTPVSGG